MTLETKKITTPESRWGHSDKPLHFTGEISQEKLFLRLKFLDHIAVIDINRVVSEEANISGTKSTVLVVGSLVDLSYLPQKDSDVDLLVCFEDPSKRHDLIYRVIKRLITKENFIEYPSRVCSAPNLEDPSNTQIKLVRTTDLHNLTVDRSFIDVTFLGAYAGSVQEELNFHRKNKLAFCLINQ